MSEGLRGVVVSHGKVGAAMVDVVRGITGDADALVAVSNEGCSRNSLAALVADAVGDDNCVVFVDLAGGSCFQAAATLQRDRPTLAVVGGVNVAMLLDFVHHRDESVTDAAARAATAGGRAIRVFGG